VRLVFSFSDDGIGIGASELKQLFRPFAQASVKISKMYGGAGLGLSLVKRLAQAMGGGLSVTSKKGKGSTFRLNVLVELFEARATAQRQDRRPGPVRPLTILCAEDNPYGRVVMNTILVERGEYDVVLMDVTLTGLNGIDAARLIRTLPGKAGRTPIVGISGRGESGDEAAARDAGMNFYFVKPVSPRKLAQALAACSSG
jgi:CheY-like chemotaxis protein